MEANTKSVLERLKREFEDGEDLKFLVSRVSVYFKTDPGWTDFVSSVLIITNFQLTFAFVDETKPQINVPITAIDSCSRKSKSRKLNLYCKDFRSLILQFSSGPELDMVYKHIGKYIKFRDPSVLAFAFWYTPVAVDPGWSLFSPGKEYERMGLTDPACRWRISECNLNYAVCDSYPELLCVPKDFTDQSVRTVAKFRSRNRLPALTWLDNRTTTDFAAPDRDSRRYSSITRCSMPLVGVSGSRNYQDESLVTMFLMSNPRQQSVAIVDCRPRAVGVGSLANGGGYEFGSGYENCKVTFMSVENIHVMRESFAQLFALLQDSKKGSSSWYSKLESASWFKHLRLIMQASMRVVEIVEREHGSALVHCTDGWDRTSQITSLAQLCLDPHYRSLEGFLLLIEKDWLWFGHKFQERTFGSERSPVFLQFLDCVHQIMHQYPCSFEFNQQLLVFLVDSLYNCRFGTFLHNSPKERTDNKTMNKTLSAWSFILTNKRQFCNPFYKPRNETLYPAYSDKQIVFWGEYYMRWTSNPFETVEDIAMKQLERAETKLLQLHATLSPAQAELLKQVIDEFPYLCDSKLKTATSLNSSSEATFKKPAKPFGTLGKSTLGKSGTISAEQVFLSSHRDSDANEQRPELFTSGDNDAEPELPEMDPAVEFEVMDRRERQRTRLESTEFREWEQNRKLNVNATILHISSKKTAMDTLDTPVEPLEDSEDSEPSYVFDDDNTNDDDEPATEPEPSLHTKVLVRENDKAAARRSGKQLTNNQCYSDAHENGTDTEMITPSVARQLDAATSPQPVSGALKAGPPPPSRKQHAVVKSFTPPKLPPPTPPKPVAKSPQPLVSPRSAQTGPSQAAPVSPRSNGTAASPPPPPRDTKPTLSPRPGLKTSPSLPSLRANGTGPTSPREGPATVKLTAKK